jgi:hypothetical protein
MLTKYTALDRNERKRFIQDGHNESVKELLTFFDKFKQKISKVDPSVPKDINQFKSLNDFENKLGAVKAKIDGESGGENLGPEKFKLMKYIKPIGSVNNFIVYKVPQSCKGNNECYKEYEALSGCGDPTQIFNPGREEEEAPKSGYKNQWCTRNNGPFNNYLTNGPYYVFKNWDTRRQYQLHYESSQFMDEADNPLGRYNKDLENKFLQFLLDKEGRIPPGTFNFDLDLTKFKVGNEDGYSIYKVGPLYYIDGRTGDDKSNKLIYFDSSIGAMKNSDGRSATSKLALKYPYNNLIKFLYKNDIVNKEMLLSSETKEKIANLESQMNRDPSNKVTLEKEIRKLKDPFKKWQELRILLNLVPENVKSFIINNSVDISDTGVTSLPNNLTINGDLDLTNTKLELPNNLTVKGILNLSGTNLKPKPDTRAGKIVR